MRVLFIGDIFGRPGRQVASDFIPKIKEERKVDFCIANGENTAGGFGLTLNNKNKLFSYGIDVVTSGNHIWDRPDTKQLLENEKCVLRPANYPPALPGKGDVVVDKDGIKVGVLNLQGRIFMPAIDCPFRTADQRIEILRAETHVIIVDFHAEATSEKVAMGRYLDGRVSAVIGTHTHVMTADEKILPRGTAYITDVGMTGPCESVIGVRIDQSLNRIMNQVPTRFSPAGGELMLSAVLFDVDKVSGKAVSIERILEKKND
ncbi:TIGR00282 family metallophosphoesterase [Candidatus Latescibacterota bacterium]